MTGKKYSYLQTLVCSNCGQSFDPHELQTFCQSCRAPLTAQYDLDLLKSEITRDEIACRPAGMWRWHELLPVTSPDQVVTLGEGDTPLLALPRLASQLGLVQLLAKDESLNPTGSFKARGLAAAISKAYELGVQRSHHPYCRKCRRRTGSIRGSLWDASRGLYAGRYPVSQYA